MGRKEDARLLIEDIAKVARELGYVPSERVYLSSGKNLFSKEHVKAAFSKWETAVRAAGLRVEVDVSEPEERRDPKVLIFDIETCPMLASIWSPKTEYVSHKQIVKHRAIIAFAALWLGDSPDKMIYMDQRKARDPRNDKKIATKLHELLDQADAVVTKNGKRFDQKVAFGRMAINDLKRPSPFHHEDIEQLFRKHFDLPYYNLDYLSQTFCKVYRKSDHAKYPGMKLWDECMAGNLDAWDEMEKYNKFDVLATWELRQVVTPWGTNLDMNVFSSDVTVKCSCGSGNRIKRGFSFTTTGKYQRYQCLDCGAWSVAKGSRNNMMSKRKREALKS